MPTASGPSEGDSTNPLDAWTTVTVKAYLEAIIDERDRRYEQRFEAQQSAVQAALSAAKEAVGKAETDSEKRFDSVNEFRGQLKDQATTLITRKEVEQRFLSLEDKFTMVDKRLDLNQGRSTGTAATWYIVVAIIAALAAIAAIAYDVGHVAR